jgi:predicted ATPase
MKTSIIAFYGNARVGKDTFFRALARENASFVRLAFADALKKDLAEFIQKQWGVDVFTMSGPIKEHIRPLLISYGMIRRAENENYWIDRIISEVYSYNNVGSVVCANDCRFTNECDYLRREFGNEFKLVGLRREGAPEGTEEEKKHEEEMKKRVDIWVDLPNIADESELASVAKDLINKL